MQDQPSVLLGPHKDKSRPAKYVGFYYLKNTSKNFLNESRKIYQNIFEQKDLKNMDFFAKFTNFVNF